jgi:O-succinylbenzoic acid--CoA ligase
MKSASSGMTLLSVPAGPAGVLTVYRHLVDSLSGESVITPIPESNRYFPPQLVDSLHRAINPRLPAQPGTVAVLTTSGSTGNPRAVEYGKRELTALNDFINSGEIIGENIGAEPQWISALPVTSIGGFNVLSRALSAGKPPIALASVAGAGAFDPQEVDEAIRACGDSPIMISLVPTQLRRLLGSELGTESLRKCSLVLVGGSVTPPSDRIRSHDEGIKAVFSYGMTETTGGCVFNGNPAPGVQVSVNPDTGVISVSGITIARGYRPQPGLGDFRSFEDQFITQDIGDIDDKGMLHVSGRIDDVVIVKGFNISLNAIKDIIDADPHVLDSFVLPNLTALVVTTESFQAAESELRNEISQRLGSLAVPNFVTVDRLPQLPNGKHDRQQILNLYG